MMKILASLVFVFACAHQAAPAGPSAPSAPVSSPPTAPPAAGAPAVLFEIDTNNLAAGPQKSVLFADGTWRLDAAGGKTSTGRLSADDLAKAQRDVASPWQATDRTGIQCHMVHAPTNYLANGKVVYSDVGCSSKVLDGTSAAALADLEKILAAAQASTATAP